MGLFGPEWNSRNISKAKAAIDKLTDQAELARAAKNARHVVVQILAVRKLTDQNVLIDIARSESFSDVRGAAVWNAHLIDKDVISDIAKNDKSIDVRECAERRLAKMCEIEAEKSIEIRKIEVQKMTDPNALAIIAKTDNNENIRATALNNKHLTDQALFAYIAIHDTNESMQISAIRRITDETVLNTVKSVYCHKDNHIWTFLTRTLSNDEAMELHDDRMYIRECLLCGIEKRLFE